MSVWDNYTARTEIRGTTKYSSNHKRESRFINNRLPDNLSYHTVTVFGREHGFNITAPNIAKLSFEQNVAIINSDNLNEKYIYSMPGEDIGHGDLIEWMGNHWLVTERDANTTVYTRAKLLQCNHLLKWVSEDGVLCEQWCVIEDGTKYLTGEYEDKYFVATRGDSRIAMTIARNEETVKFNRKNRFMIDDDDSPIKLTYLLTKPLKLGWSFNGDGCYKFVLQEVVSTDNDKRDDGIADYYKTFDKEEQLEDDSEPMINPSNVSEETGRQVWL